MDNTIIRESGDIRTVSSNKESCAPNIGGTTFAMSLKLVLRLAPEGRRTIKKIIAALHRYPKNVNGLDFGFAAHQAHKSDL